MKTNLYDYGLIGERIRQARKAQRYTQAEVAEMINMSSKNFSQLERGATGLSLATLIALCKSLDVSADYILFGMEENKQNNTVTKLLSKLDEKEQLYAERNVIGGREILLPIKKALVAYLKSYGIVNDYRAYKLALDRFLSRRLDLTEYYQEPFDEASFFGRANRK